MGTLCTLTSVWIHIHNNNLIGKSKLFFIYTEAYVYIVYYNQCFDSYPQ